jgi:DNA uptake protein ComE-like DNA-binding protein
MLREWTANGFVTRDFANFAVPFVSAPIVEKAPAPVAAKPVVPTPEKAATQVVAIAPAPVAVAPMTTVPPVAKPAAPATPAALTAPAKAPAVVVPKGVSVNTAPLAELAAVPGLSTKLAEGIVKKRPFTSLDELGRVKGFGEKLLAKVRSSLRL